MGLIANDTGADAARQRLEEYVVKCGGEAGMVAGWRTELYERMSGRSGGDTDRYWFDATGKKFRSNAEIARGLGLEGAPKVREKNGYSMTRLAPGETVAVVSYDSGPTLTFEAAAERLRVMGDFAEFVPDARIRDASTTKKTFPRRWRPLAENCYVWPAAREANGVREEPSPCDCGPGTGCAVNSGCVNRELYCECSVGLCAAGGKTTTTAMTTTTTTTTTKRVAAAAAGVVVSLKSSSGAARRGRHECAAGEWPFLPCANTAIQRHQFPPMEIFDTGSPVKGFGLRCQVAVTAGTLLGEYRGEVILEEEMLDRKAAKAPEDPFYFASLGNGLVVDAAYRGAYARFANHSCEPNCHLQKWNVGAEPRLVLVATRDLDPLVELTYDYNAGGGTADITHDQPCLCGAPNCARSIGAKPLDAQQTADRDHQLTIKARQRQLKALTTSSSGRNKRLATAKASSDDDDDDDEEDGGTASKKKKKKKMMMMMMMKKIKPTAATATAKKTTKKKTNGGGGGYMGDGPAARLWAMETLAAFGVRDHLDEATAAHRVYAIVQGAEDRRKQRDGPEELHCLCRLPETLPALPALHRAEAPLDLIQCDKCARWFHACCLGMETPSALPPDDADFTCPRCTGRFTCRFSAVWKPQVDATLAVAKARLAAYDEHVADATFDAASFLRAAADEVEAWHARARALLADGDAPDPDRLAECAAYGAMLEFRDDHLLSRLEAKLLGNDDE